MCVVNRSDIPVKGADAFRCANPKGQRNQRTGDKDMHFSPKSHHRRKFLPGLGAVVALPVTGRDDSRRQEGGAAAAARPKTAIRRD